jgi:hypothetical protein
MVAWVSQWVGAWRESQQMVAWVSEWVGAWRESQQMVAWVSEWVGVYLGWHLLAGWCLAIWVCAWRRTRLDSRSRTGWLGRWWSESECGLSERLTGRLSYRVPTIAGIFSLAAWNDQRPFKPLVVTRISIEEKHQGMRYGGWKGEAKNSESTCNLNNKRKTKPHNPWGHDCQYCLHSITSFLQFQITCNSTVWH